MSDQGRRCGTCQHYRPTRNPDTGRVLPSRAGDCAFDVTWPTLPACYRKEWDRYEWPDKLPVWPMMGSDCKLWAQQVKS